jgi:FkbM family methyltransferase
LARDTTVEFDAGLAQRLRITGDAGDTSVMATLAQAHTYEPFIVDALRRVLRPTDVVLDVGANIGVLTVVAAKLCASGRVFAFEPSPHHLRYLRANVGANAVANVSVEETAVMDAPGEVLLNRPETFQAGSYVATAHREGIAERVRATTLDEWCVERAITRCDLVKIDVEGCERLVLTGARELLARHRPYLLVECNAVTQRRFRGEGIGPLYDDLTSYASRVYALRNGERPQRVRSAAHLDRLATPGGLVDVLCVPEGRPWDPARFENARSIVASAALALHYNRWRRPPRSITHDPSYCIDVDQRELYAARGEHLRVPVTIHNTGRLWLSDRFDRNPTFLSYRWVHDGVVLDDVGGPRTSFGTLRPFTGRRYVDLAVDVDRDPGAYELDVGVVQQDLAWLVALAPAVECRMPITVRDA